MFTKLFTSFALISAIAASTPSGCSNEIDKEISKVSEVIDVFDEALGEWQESSEISKERPSEKIESNSNRPIELPGKMHGVPERMVHHYAYTLSFNRENNQPNWVAWELTAKETQGTIGRSNEFLPDPDIPLPHRVTTEDYRNSGYDRGHMAPAADMKWSQKAMKECFYMSNMCPQNGKLNSGAWGALEKACRRWAQQEGKVYIVCGPVFENKRHKKIGKEHIIPVPDGFFKVVLSLKKNKEKAIGFYYTNRSSKQSLEKAAKSVDEIEEMTGIDFFVNIPDRLEEKIEAEYSLKDWK